MTTSVMYTNRYENRRKNKTNDYKLSSGGYKVGLDLIFPMALIGLFGFELCNEKSVFAWVVMSGHE